MVVSGLKPEMRPGIPGDSGTAKPSEVLVPSSTPNMTFADSQEKNIEGDLIIS